jgi:hypothetical protein
MRNEVGFNVSRVYLVNVSWLPIGQQFFIDFFKPMPLLPIGWRILQTVRQQQRKLKNTTPLTLRKALAASQLSFIMGLFIVLHL